MQDKFLPIGSVVLLKGGTKKVMITGYCMKTAENPDKIYDYNGCPFPEGELKSNITSVFNHDQIEKIVFLGLESEEQLKVNEEVKELASEYINNLDEGGE